MKKKFLIVWLILCAPLLSFSQVKAKKPKPQPAEQKARPLKKVSSEDEAAAEIKLGQPKRVDKQAFVDLLNKGKNMMESGELDLHSPIEIEASADLSRSGTLTNIGINQKIIVAPQRELAREFIETISSSGALEFLNGVQHIAFTFRLNEATLTVSAASDMVSAQQAAQLARASNLLLETGATVKRGREEEAVYKGAHTSSSGKRVTITLSLPRGTVAKLLSKQLQPNSGQ